MRKFMKVCAMAALIFILLGLLLGVTGSLGHGSPRFSFGEVLSAVTGGRVSGDSVDRWGENVAEQIQENTGNVHYDLDDNMDFDEDYPIQEGDVERFDLGTADAGITELELEAGGCSVEVKSSEDEHFYVEAAGMRRFQGYVEENTLTVRGTAKYTTNNWKGSITLYVPEGYHWEQATLELGAGSLEAEKMFADNLEAHVGAGQMVFDELNADQSVFDCGMGQLIAEQLRSRVVDATVGMGSLQLTGDVTEQLTGECSMGELQLELSGAQTDYNYDLSCGMGELTVGDDGYSGMVQKKQINNNAVKSMDLECAMGSVSVQFE